MPPRRAPTKRGRCTSDSQLPYISDAEIEAAPGESSDSPEDASSDESRSSSEEPGSSSVSGANTASGSQRARAARFTIAMCFCERTAWRQPGKQRF